MPKVTVRKHTVVEYQPSWLLLAVPAVAILVARRKTPGSQASPGQASPPRPAADTRSPSPSPSAIPAAPRRKRAQVMVVRLARVGRRPGAATVLEQADVAVPVQIDQARRP